MALDWFWFTIAVLGVWRVTHLLAAEDGPWDMFAWLRKTVRRGISIKLFDCFYCLSLWVSAPFAFVLGATWLGRTLLWPALSGGAIIIEIVAAKMMQPPPAPYFEELPLPDDQDVLLRK
jgi:hypothetical protein